MKLGDSTSVSDAKTRDKSYTDASKIMSDISLDAIFMLSRTSGGIWEICQCNPATSRLLNVGLDRLLGMTLEEIFGKGSLVQEGRFLPDVCNDTGQTCEHEEYLAAQGDEWWVVFNWWKFIFAPVPTNDGQGACVACLCRCITDKRALQDSLKKFTCAFSQASSIIAIVQLDGTVEYINPVFEKITGFPCEGAVGQSIFQLCMPQSSDQIYAPLTAAMSLHEPWQGELPSTKKSGCMYWENVRISPICLENGAVSHYLFIKEDITEKRAIENDLRLASRVLETTDAGVLITNEIGEIRSVNPAYERITGYSEVEVLGKTPRVLSLDVYDERSPSNLRQHLTTHGSWTGELTDHRKSGQHFVQNIAISALHNMEGQITHFVGVFSDITALKESQGRLENLANFDSLTQLPNRRSLQDRLQRALLRAKREASNVALIYFDLDHFKVVNDTLGHPAGDALLKNVSHRAQKQIRAEDTLARLGGDEFVAVLEGIDAPERIAVVAERIIHEIGLPFDIDGHEVFVGCSIGIAFFPKDASDAESLMHNADLALYRAKDEGKNCYRLYSAEMNAAAHQRYQIELRLRRAIDLGELSLVYQPQFDVNTRQLTGAEALLRWSNPEIGSVSPAVFIPIAEQIGVIVQIGRWVFEKVCSMLKDKLDLGLSVAKIAVNVSPVQFRQKDLIDSFQEILQRVGVSARSIEIEVTEGALMTDPDSAIETLKKMRDMGFGIAIDDFGTGYSSLGYLRRFPIDKVKIDRTFIVDLETNPDDEAIVSAIIALSRSLGMRTIAEGVETEQQMELLSSAGCGEVQGYLLGMPMSEVDFIKVVSESRTVSRRGDGYQLHS